MPATITLFNRTYEIKYWEGYGWSCNGSIPGSVEDAIISAYLAALMQRYNTVKGTFFPETRSIQEILTNPEP